jgi:hypothetical protein
VFYIIEIRYYQAGPPRGSLSGRNLGSQRALVLVHFPRNKLALRAYLQGNQHLRGREGEGDRESESEREIECVLLSSRIVFFSVT